MYKQKLCLNNHPAPPALQNHGNYPHMQHSQSSPAFLGSILALQSCSLTFQRLWLQLLQPNSLPGLFTRWQHGRHRRQRLPGKGRGESSCCHKDKENTSCTGVKLLPHKIRSDCRSEVPRSRSCKFKVVALDRDFCSPQYKKIQLHQTVLIIASFLMTWHGIMRTASL